MERGWGGTEERILHMDLKRCDGWDVVVWPKLGRPVNHLRELHMAILKSV